MYIATTIHQDWEKVFKHFTSLKAKQTYIICTLKPVLWAYVLTCILTSVYVAKVFTWIHVHLKRATAGH